MPHPTRAAAPETSRRSLHRQRVVPDRSFPGIVHWVLVGRHFLKGLDYRKLVPHPVLERTGRNKLIPDFFLQPCGGELVDILDLKLPNKTLFTGTVDRLKLSEAVASALAQVREYKDYFENKENKARVLKQYGVTAYRPKVSVVIGLDERVLPEEKRR
jgi:hypothetical protein